MSQPASDQQLVIDQLRAELAELRASRRRLVEAELADRRALERVLHDGLQQRIVAMALEVQLLGRLLDHEPGAATAQLDEMAEDLKAAAAEAMGLAELISPPVLDVRGFASGLRSTASRTGGIVEIEVRVDADDEPEVIAVVYATCAAVLASAPAGSATKLRVREEDGGVGFDVTGSGGVAPELTRRLRDRIEALDGRLSVDDVGVGSRVQGWLPLAPSARSSRSPSAR